MPKREGASYQEIMARALRKPEHAAVPVFHADSPNDGREKVVAAVLDGARFDSLRNFHEGLREQDHYDDVTFGMLKDAAEALKLDRVANVVVVDLEVGVELLAWVDEQFPKVDDEGEDE